MLAGGGSRGAVQVGMLEALIRRGIRPDRVFGASVGAINGATYAGEPTLEGVARMADVWRAVKGTDIFPRGTFDGPWAFLQKRPAVHANTGLRSIVEAGVRYENLEEATIPIEVVTTSLTDGRERWITHGPAVEAILASAAIPSIFPPITIGGDVLVDGGVVNNVPISRALAAGCERIYVLLCGPLHYHPPPPRRPAEAALTAFFVAIHARFVRELAALPPGVEVIVFSGGGEPAGQYRDFSATAALIEEGRAEVADVLDRYAGTSHDLGAAPPAPPSPRAAGAAGTTSASRAGRLARTTRGGPARGAGRTDADALGPAVSADRYLLANEAPEAMDRFTAFAALFDPSTFRHLDRLGLAPGWRCWEVGAGGTSVLRHLAGRVGPDGRVLATDIDLSWAGGGTGPNVDVLEHDVASGLPPGGPFDLVHARLVLVHVRARDAALATMVAALRPGGVLLVEDADPALQPRSCLEETGPEQVLANRLRSGFRTLLAERGVDLAYGRSLPRGLRAAGLVDVAADAAFPVSDPACNALEVATIALIRDQLLEHGLATEAEIERHVASVRAGTLDLAQPPMVSCWGRRPPPA